MQKSQSDKLISHRQRLIIILQDELRGCYGDRSKVINQQRSLDKTRIREPTNRRKIVSNYTDPVVVIVSYRFSWRLIFKRQNLKDSSQRKC